MLTHLRISYFKKLNWKLKRTFVSRDCNYYDTVVEEEDRGSIFTGLRVGSLTQDAAILQQADKNFIQKQFSFDCFYNLLVSNYVISVIIGYWTLTQDLLSGRTNARLHFTHLVLNFQQFPIVSFSILVYFSNFNEMEIQFDSRIPLGQGGYGSSVFPGTFQRSKVAVKEVRLINKSTNDEDAENILMQLNHPNIVKLLHFYSDNNFK